MSFGWKTNSAYPELSAGNAVVMYAPQPNVQYSWSMGVAQLQASIVSASLRNDSVKRVEELGRLEDNWDGYGGFAPSKVVCEYAGQLVNRIAVFQNLPSPEITPSPSGTVVFTWETKGAEAILEIGDNTFSGYIEQSGIFVPFVGETRELGENELGIIAGSLP